MSDYSYSLKEYFGGSDTKAYIDYKAGQKAGKWADLPSYLKAGGTNTGYSSYEDSIKKAQSLAQQAVQPAVQSYQQAIPELWNRIGTMQEQVKAEVAPLQERYQNLLSQITGMGQKREDSQTKVTSGELGKRGIVGSSTLAGQTIQDAVDPIRSETQGMIKDTGFQQEQDIRGLLNQVTNLGLTGVGEERNILNMIGQLLGNAGMTGLNLGQQQSQFNQNLGQQDLARMLQSDQFNKSFGMQQDIYKNVTLPQAQYELNRPYFKPESGGTDYSQLLSFLGLGGTGTSNVGFGQTPQYTPAKSGIVEGNWISNNGSWIPFIPA
jgi:hypothetical protein